MKSLYLPAALLVLAAVAFAMLAFEPVPAGRHYEYALIQSLALAAIAALFAAGPRTFFGKGVRAAVLVCGLVLGAANLAVLRPDAEIVRAYGTVFEALDAGANPYASGTIYHEIESVGPVYGNFNYPPLEIYPYYLAYRIAGRWDLAVLTVTLIVIQALCFLCLPLMFPRLRPALFLPFLPLVLLGEVKTNVALTFLMAALILWTIRKDLEEPRAFRGRLLAVLFGLGLMTKFLILPLMAAYYAHTVATKGRRSLPLVGLDVGLALGTAALVMAPFGVLDVVRNTAVFNVVLDERAVLTTFYPNVLSGPLAAFGLQGLFPVVAFAVLAAVVAAASRLDVFSSMLASSFAFLVVATTPEPQFLPVLVFLVVVAQGLALEKAEAAVSAAPGHATADGERGRPPAPRLKGAAAAGLLVLVLAAGAAPASAAQDAAAQDAAPAPPAKSSRAWIELGIFATAVTVNYWLGNAFPEDRDFAIDLDSQMGRIFWLEGWRFDSNQFSLNWSHILGGAAYYQFGRSNGLSWPASWLMSLAGSTWWEIVGEPKEVISINDQIMTGIGGFPVGEPWYQVGHFLCHQRSPVLRALGFLNPAVKLNHWLDREDPLGGEYTQPGWHEFSLFAGARRIAAAGEARGAVYFGLAARLIALPEYGKPGEVRRAVKDTFCSEISVDYALRGGHAEETRFFSKAVTWGRFVQRIDGRGDGFSLTLGLGSAFELFKKRPLAVYDAHPVPVKTGLEPLRLDEPRRFTDKLAILHAAGPVLDVSVFRRGLKLRAVLEAYGDFALVHSNAINDYSLAHDIAGLKTVVFYYGYYYGLGGSLRASARLDFGNVRVHGLLELGAWGSIDRLDRFQDEVTNNAHLSDGRTRYLAGAGWRVPGTSFEIFAEIEGVRRRGLLDGTACLGFESKACAGLAFYF